LCRRFLRDDAGNEREQERGGDGWPPPFHRITG
jgi:hypothetical protein